MVSYTNIGFYLEKQVIKRKLFKGLIIVLQSINWQVYQLKGLIIEIINS